MGIVIRTRPIEGILDLRHKIAHVRFFRGLPVPAHHHTFSFRGIRRERNFTKHAGRDKNLCPGIRIEEENTKHFLRAGKTDRLGEEKGSEQEIRRKDRKKWSTGISLNMGSTQPGGEGKKIVVVGMFIFLSSLRSA